MPRFGHIKRKNLISYLKQLGFKGPYYGTKHQFMLKGDLTLWIPNPHKGDIGKDLLSKILRQANVSKDEWERL